MFSVWTAGPGDWHRLDLGLTWTFDIAYHHGWNWAEPIATLMAMEMADLRLM